MKKLQIFTKAVAMLLILSIVFSIGACDFLKGSLELKSFTVDQRSVKTEWFIGETVDFSGIKAEAIYSDASLNHTYTFDELTFSNLEGITDTSGKKTVTVSFKDENLDGKEQTASFVITVREDPNAVKHASYYIDTANVKTQYDIGDELDFAGVKLFERWNNGTTTEVTLASIDELTFDTSKVDMNTIGVYSVAVSYKGESAGSISIEVGEIPFTSALSGTYQTSCEAGQTLDFSALTVTVSYEDGTTEVIANKDLTISAVDTSTVGDKTVTVSFIDPVNSIPGSLDFKVTVIKAKEQVADLSAPLSIEKFFATQAAAGTKNYGDEGFENIFIDGSSPYVVGDDNAFKFVPSCFILNSVDVPIARNEYYATIELSIFVDGAFKPLSKTADQNTPTLVSYFNGETLIATVDTFYGNYDFAEAAIGELIHISVLPSADHYKIPDAITAIELTVSVIDAFNIYSARQLAVIDNLVEADRDAGARAEYDVWGAYKLANGIANIDPAGIVLHNDLELTTDCVPASYFCTTTEEIVCKNAQGEIKTMPVGTKLLLDWTNVYKRVSDKDFRIEGNYFTLDLSKFPTIATNKMPNDKGDAYGSDFSNSTLFFFTGSFDGTEEERETAERAKLIINNFEAIGNAPINSYQDDNGAGDLVSAGGVIFIKTNDFIEATFTNILTDSFFITYFPELEAHLTLNKAKAYDSFQNTAMIWADGTFTVNDSFFSGAGGPIVIAQSVSTDSSMTNYLSPKMHVTNTVMDAKLTGSDVWFKAVNATPLVTPILDQINPGLKLSNLCSITNTDGEMNIVAILMNSGDDPQEIITGFNAEGTVDIDGMGIERWRSPEYLWNIIFTDMNPSTSGIDNPLYDAFAIAGAPFFTVDVPNGETFMFYFDGQGFTGIEVTQTGVQTRALFEGGKPTDYYMALSTAIAQSKYITLSQQGFSIVFEMFPFA